MLEDVNYYTYLRLVDGKWYYKTANEGLEGPFDTLAEAKTGLVEYLRWLDEDTEA